MMVAALYDLLFLIPLCVAASVFGRSFSQGTSPLLWTCTAVFAVLYYILIKHSDMRKRMIIAGVSVTFVIATILFRPAGERLMFVKANTWVLAAVGVAVLCIIIEILAQRYRYVHIILAAAFIIMMPVMLITENHADRACVIAMWAYAAMSAADTIERHSHKEGDSDPKKHLVFISPFIIALFLIVSFVKPPEERYDWGFVKKISKAVVSEAAIIADKLSGSSWDSDSPVIGFSDRGKIGGNLKGFGYDVIDIRASKAAGSVIYLAGKEYEGFDGRQWNSSRDIYDEDGVVDTIATLAGIIAASGEDPIADAAKDVSLTVEFINLPSGQVFTPAKSFGLDASAGKRYYVSYYVLNARSAVVDELTEDEYEITKEDWDEAIKLCGADEKKYPFERYEEYRKKQYEMYAGKTVISQRLAGYMDEVLEGCDTDRDRLSRIAAMLRECTYTDTPGTLPESIDAPAGFLDHLIFEKQEGYCTYFATAFVLLARSQGIPARYVQGYRVNTDGSLHCIARSTDAHAWPMAYIDGLGWTVFEPTPGMQGSEAYGWQTDREREAAQSTVALPDKSTEEESTLPEKKMPIDKTGWKRIALSIIAGLLVSAILIVADNLLKKRRYARLDENGKALWLCRKNMQYLKKRGLGKHDGETLFEYKNRLAESIDAELLDFTGIYETLLYSGKTITKEERIRLEYDCKALYH